MLVIIIVARPTRNSRPSHTAPRIDGSLLAQVADALHHQLRFSREARNAGLSGLLGCLSPADRLLAASCNQWFAA